MLKPIGKLFALALLAIIGFSACSDDDEPQTISALLEADARFSTLKSALDQTGLTATLEASGTFTLFAPDNAAFTGVDLSGLTDAQLTEILLYHVLGVKVNASGIATGKSYASTAAATGPNGTNLSVLIENASSVRLNNTATVTETDIEASNGVIHVIDGVITPLDVVGHASANTDFSELVGALVAADGDLVTVLGGTGPFTVFAPINQAFIDIAAVTSTLTGAELAGVLTYHVVSPANVQSSSLTDGQTINALGGDFTINIDGTAVTATDANAGVSNVIITDVQATNGIIHAIDRVLLP